MAVRCRFCLRFSSVSTAFPSTLLSRRISSFIALSVYLCKVLVLIWFDFSPFFSHLNFWLSFT